MKPASYFHLRALLAGTMVLLSPLAVFSASTTTHSKFTGIYRTVEDKTGPFMNLSLGADGTATVTEDAGKGAMTFFGHWADSGDQVTVTFNADEGTPPEPPMVFAPYHDGLQAVTWNHAVWGKVTPPPMKKGYKVKQRYWFTTVP